MTIFALEARINFDMVWLILILFFAILLVLKITSYIKYAGIKDVSRSDIIFLVVFILFLFVPMTHINKENISETENRTLAKWHNLINKDRSINYNFGRNFDEWFNDRFYLRKPIYQMYHFLTYKLSNKYYHPTENIWMNKQNNWFTYCIGPYSSQLYDNETLQVYSEKIAKIQEFCKKNNIKPYILITPIKPTFARELAAPIKKDNSFHLKTLQAVNYIAKHNKIDIIYPYEEIEQLYKKEPTRAFFKSDHHWTDEAAYLAYRKLMLQIKKDFPNIHITNEDEYNYFYVEKVRVGPGDFNIGATAIEANIRNEEILDTEYKYFAHKNSNNIQFSHKKLLNNLQTQLYYYKNPISAPNLYIYGDSYCLNMLPSIVNSFKNTQVLYTYAHPPKPYLVQYFKNEIIKSHADIVVFCFLDIDRVANLCDIGKD